ncbi:MAG: hypothetical protein KY468_00580 [Armatimonadetes bacterium]|nr:hypothetical protein [Armatimonadota bacterium]
MKKLVLGILVAAQALAVSPAFAGAKGRQNTAALLTGAAVYSWVRNGQRPSEGRRNTAVATTAGAAYAWYNYNNAKKAQRRKERARTAYYRNEAARNKRLANYYKSRAARTARSRSTRSTRYARR